MAPILKRYRWLVAALAVVAVALGIFAAVGEASSTTFTLTGSLIIVDQSSLLPDQQTDTDNCFGTGGFADLVPGTAVVVQDPTGRTIATGSLGTGRRDPVSGACLMPFTVPDVQDGLASYSVTISRRGTQVVSSADAHRGVVLTITAGP